MSQAASGSSSIATHAFDIATRDLLDRYSNWPASLEVHLYATHFRFGHQPGLFLRDSPGWSFLACLRDQRLPEDLREVLGTPRFSTKGSGTNIPFYEGCLIVELYDHRKAAETVSQVAEQTSKKMPSYPARHLDRELHSAHSGPTQEREEQVKVCRIVLWPQQGSLASDVARLAPHDPNSQLSMEARILALTQPLCLEPDIAVSRVANHAWNLTMPRPCTKAPSNQRKKRKAEAEELSEARERRMRLMDESYGRSFTPTWVLFSVIFGVFSLNDLSSFSRLAMGQQIREQLSSPEGNSIVVTAPQLPPQPSSASTSSQQPMRSQHPLAQSHFPPPSSTASVTSTSSTATNNRNNLTLTLPARKSSASTSPAPPPSLPAVPAPPKKQKQTKQQKKAKRSQTKDGNAGSGESAAPSPSAGTPSAAPTPTPHEFGAWPTL